MDDTGEVGNDADQPQPIFTHGSEMLEKPVSSRLHSERENTDADVQQVLDNVEDQIGKLGNYFK